MNLSRATKADTNTCFLSKGSQVSNQLNNLWIKTSSEKHNHVALYENIEYITLMQRPVKVNERCKLVGPLIFYEKFKPIEALVVMVGFSSLIDTHQGM